MKVVVIRWKTGQTADNSNSTFNVSPNMSTYTHPIILSLHRVPSSNTLTPSSQQNFQFCVHSAYLFGVFTKRPARVRLAVINSIFLAHFGGSVIFVVCLVGLTFVFCWAGPSVCSLDFHVLDVKIGSVMSLSCFRCTRFLLSHMPSSSTAYERYP